jgi:RNA polymerase II subunit A-like phosphatase
MTDISSIKEALNKEFIARLAKQVTLKPSPVSPLDFPHLDWSLAEGGLSSGGEQESEIGTQLGFYDLQIPCATTNARHDRKLSLVLDLDQTLVHAVKLNEMFSDILTGPLRSEAESFIATQVLPSDNPKLIESYTERIEFRGSSLSSDPEPRQLLATRLDGEMYLIKLRPGLRGFVQELASMYELHIYTKANRNYLNFLLYELDPLGKLFTSAVARDDSPDLDTDLKILDRVCCRNMAEVVVFDDRVDVWNETPANVVRAQPYNYLTLRRMAVVKAVEELVFNGNGSTCVFDYDGHLYAIKKVLVKIYNKYVENGAKRPAPEIISEVRKQVLAGVKLQFTGFTEAQTHMREAEEFGATCSTIDDSNEENPAILVAAKHTKRVYDLSKAKAGNKIVHWSWMEHVRSTWQQPSLSMFDLNKFRMDSSGVYPAIDDWEVAWLAGNADPRGSDIETNVSSKRRR